MKTNSEPIPVGFTVKVNWAARRANWVFRQQVGKSATVTSWRVLLKGELELVGLPLTVRGVAGVEGGAIPRGRLPALMQAVTHSDQMSQLCWAVLRRYGKHNQCLPNPPKKVRQLAHKAIDRARKHVEDNHFLWDRPDDYWPGPVPESDGSLWPISKPQDITLGEFNLSFVCVVPLDDLLTHDIELNQLTPSVIIRPTVAGQPILEG